MAKEVVLRRLTCRWPDCGLVFYICNSCYRRQAYCGDVCRKKAQLQQHRKSNQKHQDSEEGRLDHRDRQRAYVERRHRRMTDATSPRHDRSVTIGAIWTKRVLSASLTDKLQGEPWFERLQDAIRPVCMLCGRGGRVGVERIGPERRQ